MVLFLRSSCEYSKSFTFDDNVYESGVLCYFILYIDEVNK